MLIISAVFMGLSLCLSAVVGGWALSAIGDE